MTFTAADLRRVVWTFIFAFLVTLAGLAQGWTVLPNYSTAKAAGAAALLAGVQAVASFIKNFALADSSRIK